MSQLFVPPSRIQGDRFSLDPLEAHHVLRVLRKKLGDQLTFFDGEGHRFEGQLTVADLPSNRVEGQIFRWLPLEQHSASIVLVQGLPKGPKWDYVIEKAVELGVDAIVPFLGERSPIELDKKAATTKVERWSRVAQSAAKQCNRASVPLISVPQPLMSLDEPLSRGSIIVCSTDGEVVQMKQALASIGAGRIFVVIGPESGFSSTELTWLKGKKAQFASLGTLTLRTETAGLVAITLIRHLMGEM